MKDTLLQAVSLCLLKHSFTVKHFQGCLDLVARKDDFILLLKTVEDANSVREDVLEQIKRISDGVGGSALLISEKAGQALQDQVVYTRQGVPVVTVATLQATLQHTYPFVFSKKSGLTAKLVATHLCSKLDEENISSGSLSRKLGITSRMVLKYKQGDAEISLQRALKLYQVLGGEVFAPIDIFSGEPRQFTLSSSPMSKKYHELGFSTIATKKVPFDIIAKKDKEVILTKVGDKMHKDIGSLSKLVDAQDLVIFSKKKPKDIPALSKEEFLDFAESDALLKFLKEFD